MKRISVYVKNENYVPSAYYSATQYIKRMEAFNGHIHSLYSNTMFLLSMKSFFRSGIGNILRKVVMAISVWIKATCYFLYDIYFYKPNIVLVCKSIFPVYMPSVFTPIYLKFLKDRRIIWLFDDNILKSGEVSRKEWNILCKHADRIMVTHGYLAQELPQRCQEIVSFIPQADGDITREAVEKNKDFREASYHSVISLVWVATSAGIPNMLYILKSLDNAAMKLNEKHDKKLVLNIVCNFPIKQDFMHLRINNITWTREVAIDQMTKGHIGIMPLLDNEYNRGKGGFKLVQYMTADMPVIASRVGWNCKIIGSDVGILVEDADSTDCWIDAIMKLAIDYEYWKNCSLAARKKCEAEFSFKANLLTWKGILEIGEDMR